LIADLPPHADLPGVEVVHGTLNIFGRRPFWHAWIEMQGEIFDVTLPDGGLSIERAYELWEPTEVRRYTAEQAIRNAIAYGHYGPWEGEPRGFVEPEWNPKDGPFGFDSKRAREVMAVRMIDWGRIGESYESIGAYLADILDVPVEQAWEIHGRLDNDLYDAIVSTKNALDEHEAVGPIPEEHVRFVHSVLHGATPEKRWRIIESILKDGLKPQPEGIGSSSEAPWLVFGIARVEPEEREYRDLLYNQHMPYVTADIPFEAIREFGDFGSSPPEQSTQMMFHQVPRKYIVAINGLPVDDFVRAMNELGYPAPELRPEPNPGREEKNPLLV
jgi:hypothetical protein